MLTIEYDDCVCVRVFDPMVLQGSHRFEMYLKFEGFLEKSLKIKSALKST